MATFLATGLGLFDVKHRTDFGPRRRVEPAFAFLNRAARPEFDLVRDLLESWFVRFPNSSAPDVRQRFRSGDDRQHEGAMFELLVHELLFCMGWAIQTHPEIRGSSRHPALHRKLGLHKKGRLLHINPHVSPRACFPKITFATSCTVSSTVLGVRK